MPTTTQRRTVEGAGKELESLSRELEALTTGELRVIREALDAAGAPWIPRR